MVELSPVSPRQKPPSLPPFTCSSLLQRPVGRAPTPTSLLLPKEKKIEQKEEGRGKIAVWNRGGRRKWRNESPLPRRGRKSSYKYPKLSGVLTVRFELVLKREQ